MGYTNFYTETEISKYTLGTNRQKVYETTDPKTNKFGLQDLYRLSTLLRIHEIKDLLQQK